MNLHTKVKPQPPSRSAIPGDCFGTFKLPKDVAFSVARGAGSKLFTTDGREFLDFVIGSGPMVLGHAHPQVVDALARQAALGTTFYTMNEQAMQLAECVRDLVPCAEAVKLVSDGSEATFYALRLARAFTGRTHVLKFEGAYHGHHDYALQSFKPPLGMNYPDARPDSAGIPGTISDTMLIAPYNDLERATEIAEGAADRVAAIIVEPVQRAIMPKPGFLEGLRALCDRIGAVLIFDEIVTGFRVSMGGAQELFGVTPDLCSLGKVMGGGLPLAAVAGRYDIIALSDPGRPADGRSVYISGTLNGNPLASAAGLATIEALIAEDGIAHMAERGTTLRERLLSHAESLSIPFDVIGPPSFGEPIFGEGDVVDYRSYMEANRAAAQMFGNELLKRGIFVHPASKVYVSAAHSDADIDAFSDASLAAMKVVRDSGVLK